MQHAAIPATQKVACSARKLSAIPGGVVPHERPTQAPGPGAALCNIPAPSSRGHAASGDKLPPPVPRRCPRIFWSCFILDQLANREPRKQKLRVPRSRMTRMTGASIDLMAAREGSRRTALPARAKHCGPAKWCVSPPLGRIRLGSTTGVPQSEAGERNTPGQHVRQNVQARRNVEKPTAALGCNVINCVNLTTPSAPAHPRRVPKCSRMVG